MKLVSRSEWGARAARRRVKGNLFRPSTGHWNGPTLTVGGQPVWDHSKCAGVVRGIQNFHMDGRGWSDIAYNFVVCAHGVVFEGRGLNVINAANGTNAGNQSSHAIMCPAGEGNPFTDAEKIGFRECVEYISQKTDATDQCIGHRDHKSTECPGNVRYVWIHKGMSVQGKVPDPVQEQGTPVPVVDHLVKLGMTGEEVRRVQQIIFDKAGGNISVDGVFGPQTESRVKDVQSFFKLEADGIVGPRTWAVLQALDSVGANPYGNWPNVVKPMLKFGVNSQAVRYLQNVIALKCGGNIAVDGAFGNQTLLRVKDVQRTYRLDADGIVGSKTWSIIDKLARS